MQVRQEQLALKTQLSNVEDVGSSLGTPVPFLAGMQSQFDEINNKLDDLAAAVKDMADRLRMMTGRPVMDVLEARRQELVSSFTATFLTKCTFNPSA